MFSARESESDLLIHRMALFGIVFLMALVLLQFSKNAALAYMHLDRFGFETEAEIIKQCADERDNKCDPSSVPWTDTIYTVKFQSDAGEPLTGMLTTRRLRSPGQGARVYPRVGDSVRVIHSTQKPELLRPVALFEAQVADRNIFLGSVFGCFVSLVLGALTAIKFYRFKKASRYY